MTFDGGSLYSSAEFGNTGLTGASQPHDDMSEIILSTSRMIAHIARTDGRLVGWSNTDGIYRDGVLVAEVVAGEDLVAREPWNKANLDPKPEYYIVRQSDAP